MKSKKKKDCMVQVRCTEEEKERLSQLALDSKMSCSEFMRHKLFDKCLPEKKNVIFTVAAQEFLNCAQETYGTGRVLERKVDALWNILNS